MAKKKKETDGQMMQKMVESIAEEIGVKLNFEPAKALQAYKKGRALTMGDLKKAAKMKTPVWVYYKEHGGEFPRINHAQWVDIERKSFIFSDGTSFGSDMDIGPDEAPATDPKCGEGHFEVFEAIKMTKEEEIGLKKALKELEAFKKKHKLK